MDTLLTNSLIRNKYIKKVHFCFSQLQHTELRQNTFIYYPFQFRFSSLPAPLNSKQCSLFFYFKMKKTRKRKEIGQSIYRNVQKIWFNTLSIIS